MDQWNGEEEEEEEEEVGGDACVARARRGYIGLT
jgi:hypothetical protein